MLPKTSFCNYLSDLHRKYQALYEGQVASYIPEIAKANPDWFGICVVDLQGKSYAVGDCDQPFTIQSVSKPFVYGMALEEHGRDYVLSKVDVEPTGDPFNSIIRLDERSKRASNPMVNAGAIATANLIGGTDPADRFGRVLAMFERYIGHSVSIDVPVFLSERSTGHRNRAMAHLMLNFGMIDERIEETLDLYFQQCSVLVTCRDLAIMAATLANNGVHPVTGERAISETNVKYVLSVMHTCGMYDFSGEWAFKVGLPAKSGVTGGILVVVPGRMGIGVFSPLLEPRGNSLRGIRVCEALSSQYNLHVFNLGKHIPLDLD